MKKEFISILIVSYNAEKYIEETIESCLNQTCANIEVLLLDNDSKDKTVEIVKMIQLSDNRLKIFESKENLGPYAGLNFLIEKAGGEYIAIQDHDDVWFPKKIEKQVEFLEKNKDFIACGANTFYYYEAKEILILNKKPAIADFVDHTSLMFRNRDFRYNESYLLADEYFEKKILSKQGRIACIQDPLVVHCIKSDGTNFSSSRFKFSSRSIKEFFEINKFNLNNLLYFLDIILSKYLSEKIVWLIRKKLTQRNNHWVSLEKFKIEYPNVML